MSRYKRKRANTRRCELPGCGVPVVKQGLCPAHHEEEKEIRRLMTELHDDDEPAGSQVQRNRQQEYTRPIHAQRQGRR